MQRGQVCDSRGGGGQKRVCGTHHSTAHGACLVHTLRETRSALPRDELFVPGPVSSASSNAASSDLPLPPPSITVLIYSEGCYPNEPPHASYRSSPQAVRPQLLAPSTYTSKNASSIFPEE